MVKRHSGQTIVEAILLLPLFAFLSLGFIDLSLFIIQQFVLERFCTRVTRDLSLRSLSSHSEMQSYIETEAHRRFLIPTQVGLRMYEIPTLPQNDHYRQRKKVHVIDVSLTQAWTPKFVLLRHFGVDFVNLRARTKDVLVSSAHQGMRR